ncbi:uncharacterized protein [Aquarana catesbeiana]|uniref:uncharacterized protein isoform X1 n=1 Tax=Aquarana catesbeiana TaxID=8400 RepID=UPI003CCA5689
MDFNLLILGLLLALVTPGYSVKCFECYNITDPSCTGPTKECSSGICMSGLISFNEYTLFGRACAPNISSCSISGTMTSPNGNVQLSTSCCNADNCTPGALNLPTRKSVKNGVFCQTCTSTTDESCKLECKGEEKYCANVELTTLGPSVGPRLHGCATDSICYFQNQTFDIDGTVYHLGITCGSPPSLHLQQCFMFIILALAASLKYN